MSIQTKRPSEPSDTAVLGRGRRISFVSPAPEGHGTKKATMGNVRRAWQFDIDFIGRMRAILWLSATLTLAAIAVLAVRGLELGTDFAGGYEIEVHFPEAVSETHIRELLAPLNLDDARVQSVGAESSHEFLVLVRHAPNALDVDKQIEVRRALEALVPKRTDVKLLSFAESGERIEMSFAQPVAREAVKAALAGRGIEVTSLTGGERKDRPDYSATVASLADDIVRALSEGLKLAPGTQIMQRIEFVGPQVGADLRNEGILAVVWSLALILFYVAVRFDMYFAPGAIVATVHDLILTMAIFSLLGLDFNLNVVAAILTLIGFSLNDTIVVFDRIRENVGGKRVQNLRKVVNDSINETLSRTVLTSGTVALVSLSLLVLGGVSLRGFSAVMLIGVVVGTYSSIFVASPVYIALREYGERRSKTKRAAA